MLRPGSLSNKKNAPIGHAGEKRDFRPEQKEVMWHTPLTPAQMSAVPVFVENQNTFQRGAETMGGLLRQQTSSFDWRPPPHWTANFHNSYSIFLHQSQRPATSGLTSHKIWPAGPGRLKHRWHTHICKQRPYFLQNEIRVSWGRPPGKRGSMLSPKTNVYQR